MSMNPMFNNQQQHPLPTVKGQYVDPLVHQQYQAAMKHQLKEKLKLIQMQAMGV